MPDFTAVYYLAVIGIAAIALGLLGAGGALMWFAIRLAFTH